MYGSDRIFGESRVFIFHSGLYMLVTALLLLLLLLLLLIVVVNTTALSVPFWTKLTICTPILSTLDVWKITQKLTRLPYHAYGG
jgi:uncharacterized integral membrane protein